jgi:hypothetical protein
MAHNQNMLAIAAFVAISSFSPANELAMLAAADQGDRSFTKVPTAAEWEPIAARDRARRARVREILLADEARTADDFSHAALIFQHGETPSDYLLAHDLSAIALQEGKFETLAALAEDRWLESIGRLQRWGSQFDWDGNLKPLFRDGVTVSDAMREDLMLPTLPELHRYGMQAVMRNIDKRGETLAKRLDPKSWHALPELRQLARDPRQKDVSRVVRLARSGALVAAEDFRNAARILSISSDPNTLLLAHELCILGLSRRDQRSGPLFASTLDKYLAATGLAKRYVGGSVCPAVKHFVTGL